jgi:hypothetical protein
MRASTRTLRALAAVFMAFAALVISVTSVAAPADGSSGGKIVISGASGQLGGLVVKELLARGVPAGDLILVSRTPDKLDEFRKLGAATRFGDFAKPESRFAPEPGG